MRLDFSLVPDPDTDRINIPAGHYVCRVKHVEERRTRDGSSEQWGLMLEVVDGPHAGAMAAWDNLTFSERGMPRVKLALRAFGFDVSGVIDFEGDQLVGRRASVEVVEDEYVDPKRGIKVRRLAVPYSGYTPAPDGADDGAGEPPEQTEVPEQPEGGGGPGTAAAERLPW